MECADSSDELVLSVACSPHLALVFFFFFVNFFNKTNLLNFSGVEWGRGVDCGGDSGGGGEFDQQHANAANTTGDNRQ